MAASCLDGLQDAIEAPRLSSEHFPGLFAPHESVPNRVRIEARFGPKVMEELRLQTRADAAP